MSVPQKKFYVTTPIYYANSKPHLGTLYTTILADSASRYYKLLGADTFFLTGTDEHGQKIFEAAKKLNTTPQELVDQTTQEFKKTWELYAIKYDYFIRTTDKNHIKGVQTWLKKLIEKGDVYKGKYSGHYCTPCETFVTEKPVNNKIICPSCGRETIEISEESYFFKLSNYQQKLLDFYNLHPNFITPVERTNEIKKFVESGLKDLCISRKNLKWGIPFPGDEEHTVYVWADALNNYLTGIGYGDEARTEELKKWWPADLQTMAKDIFKFHAVYWPAFLMASDIELPKKLLVHGFIQLKDQKMSKSFGNVVDPNFLAQEYGPDSIRYYLIRHFAIIHDAPFDIENLVQKINSELANDLGNLLNRVLILAQRNNLEVIKPNENINEKDLELKQNLEFAIENFEKEMEEFYFHRAYNHLWKFIHDVNAYFHAQEPWKIAKNDPERFNNIISTVCHSLYAIAILMWPAMPKKSEKILNALSQKLKLEKNLLEELKNNPWDKTFNLNQVEPIFKKFELQKEEKKENLEEKTEKSEKKYIEFEDFLKVELIAGTILKCEEVEKSDKLYKLRVDFGNLGTRQILSGIKKYFSPEDLIGKQGVFVLNLKPRKILGLESQGMMLLTERKDGSLAMATVSPDVPNGNRLH